jgi:tRNA U38,U39,U40 pseudouridine synthase TruA
MVRNIVGTLMLVGKSKIAPNDVEKILTAKKPSLSKKLGNYSKLASDPIDQRI